MVLKADRSLRTCDLGRRIVCQKRGCTRVVHLPELACTEHLGQLSEWLRVALSEIGDEPLATPRARRLLLMADEWWRFYHA